MFSRTIFQRVLFLLLMLFLLLCCNCAIASAAVRYKVLIVFSYEQTSLWEGEIREELERVLQHEADLTFFYLNTNVDFSNGAQKAAEAYRVYQELKPDGVITVDDHAQSLFVVPYLKDKTDIPVVFCGVNGDPEDYGYPTDHITGVLERYHFEETFALNRLIAGKTDTFVLMVNKSPSADLMIRQFNKQKARMSVQPVAILSPETLEEAIAQAHHYREQVDLLFLLTLKGLTDTHGRAVNEAVAISEVVAAFDKPTAATAEFAIKNGILGGVLATGHEQGLLAGKLLLKAMAGIPVNELPLETNFLGRRMVNVTTMKNLGIDPEWMAIRGVDLVCTDQKNGI